MKTKDFVKRAKELGCYVHHNEYMENIVLQSTCKSTVFGSASTKHRYFNVHSSASNEVAELVIEYGMTPVGERSEEKKYVYEFPHHIKGMGYERERHIHKGRGNRLSLDASGQEYALTSSNFHFTKKEVEEYSGKERALFETCDPIEVTE